MKHALALLSASLFAAFLLSAHPQPVGITVAPVGPFLDGAFPALRPGAVPGAVWSAEDAFPELEFLEPVRVLPHPNGTQIVVASKTGELWLFNDDQSSSSRELILSIETQYTNVGESGIAGFAFHPEFGDPTSPNRGFLYVWHRWSLNNGLNGTNTPGYDRLSRFTVPDGSNVFDASSELVLIQQYDRQQFHIGGAMFFGPEGFLYLSVGDEGNGLDRAISTQRVDLGLFSGVLRIDVDQDPSRSHPIRRQPLDPASPPSGWPSSFSQNYYIPNDNPFVDVGGGNLEEFYAIGLRHPWTMALDEETGLIWSADVGQAQREEVNVIERTGNYEWGYREGTINGVIPEPPTVIGDAMAPLWEYDHNVGRAIIGDGVYRGELFPELVGKYLCSDFTGGQLWAIERAPDGTAVVEQIGEVPAGFSAGINSYCLTPDGRILMAKTAGGLNPGGKIYQLVRSGTPTEEPPALLSETGFFGNLATLEPHPAAIPYDLVLPFWSDGAAKTRWMCIPNDGIPDSPAEQIGFDPQDPWSFPVGTVLVKHFELDLDETAPGSNRRLETRFLVHAEDGYYGVTYRWREDGSDADLLTTSEQLVLTVETAQGPREQIWDFPSRSECLRCHNANAGDVLGPKARQLNRELEYPGSIVANQLETLDQLGFLSPPLGGTELSAIPTLRAIDDLNASVESRARSYLDVNCSYCHLPGGVRGEFDARVLTPLCEQNLLFGELNESQGIEDAAVLVPGAPERSMLFLRDGALDETAMPPLAKNRLDDPWLDLLEEWILDLDASFTLGNDWTSDGPFIDGHHPSLYINESDTFTNLQAGERLLRARDFHFYARRLGNPLTPILVRVDGEDEFTVIAIGTTRTQFEYEVGENTFLFDESGPVELLLAPGETIAPGFLDSYPDGSGWGLGTVIPADQGTSEDEIWGLLPAPLILQTMPFDGARDTALVAVGENPVDTNVGRALNEFTGLRRSYRFAVEFEHDCSIPEPPEDVEPSDFQLGNDPTIGGPDLDTWTSNLVLNETDTYTNSGTTPESIRIEDFDFFAERLADPVTPFVVQVHGDNDFTVLAIGTTRTTYSVGPNSFPFDEAGDRDLELLPGETIATGFLDAFPDGSGGGSGSVIPATFDSGDELWYSGGPQGNESASIAEGLPPTPGDRLLLGLVRSYSYAINFRRVSTGFVLGNDATMGGPNLDGWSSNLVINETDVFANTSSSQLTVYVDEFAFYADRIADPVTPFIVEVHGDNDFTVLAIGTTRTGYVVGANQFPFDDAGSRELTLAPGTTIATGFIDAFPDGSGSGTGSVIPGDFNGEDELWYTGGLQGSNSGSIAEGLPPMPGTNLLFGQVRTYAYSIGLRQAVIDTSGLQNPSFEADSIAGDREVRTSLSAWNVVQGDVELIGAGVFAAADGALSLDLNGTQPGAIEQPVSGLNSGTRYTLYASWADQQERGNTPALAVAEISLDGQVLGTLRTTSNAPGFIDCNGFEFDAPSDGEVVLRITSLTAGAHGIVIDDLRLEEGTLPLPPASTSIVNGSFEEPLGVADPHACGFGVPGWLVTQENVDVVGQAVWAAFEGAHSLDLGGHGPGGVAQTITELVAGDTYTLSFAFARHRFWGTAPLTADVLIDGNVVLELVADSSIMAPNWQPGSVEFVASGLGQATIEFRSTSLDVGGGVVIDDVRLDATCSSGPDCDGDGIADVCEADCDADGVPDDCEADCNEDGIPDDCDPSSDCDGNGLPDPCDPDCDADGLPDACEIDCNANGIPDDCESGADCDVDGIPDDCEPDCDADGLPDDCEADCDSDGVPDDCSGDPDCDGNGVPDSCDPDCDADGIPDACEADCDSDGTPDDCEPDCDSDGLPDDCEPDCDGDGTPDDCSGEPDCDDNGIPDSCDPDCDGDGTPDACEADCDADGTPDVCEPDCDADGTPDDCEPDCDADGVPDDCEPDCDADGVPDDCSDAPDCDGNGVPDSCEPDCDSDGIPDACEPDCDADGIPDDCSGAPDCDANGIPDSCQADCDTDGTPDTCEQDCDGNGIPDDCDEIVDCNDNGVPDECDIASGTSIDVDGQGVPDECENLGSIYCDGEPNSVSSSGAKLRAFGSTLLSDADLTLQAYDVPPGVPGLFFYGDSQAQAPFGDGVRCIGNPIRRLNPLVSAGADGVSTRQINFAVTPALPFTPGSSWNFQLWYRDAAGGPSGFNTSSALQVDFD